MHKKNTLFIIFFFSFSFNILANDYLEKYYQFYSTELHALRIRNAENGGYYILANALSENRLDFISKQLIKTDSLGNQLWMLEVDGQEGPPGHMNSDFVISRDTFIYVIAHFIGCFSDGSITKFDRNGNVIYNTDNMALTFPESKLTAITSTSNNDQIIGGYISQGPQCIIRYPFLARMNINGTLSWTTQLDTILYSGISIIGLNKFSDSSYIVNLSNSTSILVNDSGKIIPSNFPNGKFIVSHSSNYIISNTNYFEKVDSNLAPIWQSTAFTDLTILDITTNESGAVFISGIKDTCNGEMFISAYDSSGNNLWTKIYGGDLNDAGECILIKNEDHIVSIGTHSIHQWSVFEHPSFDCILFVTHTATLRLVKLPMEILTNESINSSKGRYDICPGDSIVLSAPAGFSYLWNTGETSQQIVANATGIFSVLIEDQFGNIEPLPEFNTYLYSIPTFTQIPDVTFTQCSGNFDFCVILPYNNSIYDRDFTWYSSAVPYSVGNKPSIVDRYNGLAAATYYCVVSNVCGSDTSEFYNLLSIAPSVSLGPDTILCSNDSLLFTFHTSAFRPYITWQDGSHLSEFWAVDTTLNSVNSYIVTIDDQNGCLSSDTLVVTFDNCASVNEIENNANSKIYPNPFTDKLTLENIAVGSVITLSDVIGNTLLSKLISDNSEILILSNLANGVYFIRIKNASSETVKKLLKTEN